MDDALLTVLLWGVSLVPLICLTAALGYFYFKEREKRKLMFATAIGFACPAYLYKMLQGFSELDVIGSSLAWASLPLISAVAIASLSSLLKLRNFDKPFKLFLLVFAMSILFLFFNIEKTVFVGLCGILSVLSFAAVTKLITITRERSPLMFLLALLFFLLSGIGLGMDFLPELTVFTSFLGVWFTAIMLVTSKSSSEENMASFFVMKKELATAKKRFEMLFNLMPDPAAIVDGEGKLLEVSDRIEEITGYKKEELIGKNFLKTFAVASNSEAVMGKNLTDRPAGSTSIPYEVKALSKDDRELMFELSAAEIDYGESKAELVVIRDRTERKKMEQALLESEEKFHSMTTFAKYAIILTDADGSISYWNFAAEKIFGYLKEEAVGEKIFEFLVPERFRSDFEKVFRNEFKKREQDVSMANTIELLSVAKNRTEFPIEISLSAFKMKDRWHMACIANDITDRKRMEETLLKSEKFAVIGELATMVAHDLRNPLQGISNAVYYLRNKLNGKMDKDVLRVLELIKSNVKYSDKIVSDLLDYSTNVQLHLEKITLKLIVAESFSLVEVPENIRVTERIAEELTVEIDLETMKRVFVNILRNAIDAMPNGGTLTIESKESEENVELTFKDTGAGMTKQTLDRLFTPLFTTKAKGMGFGLAICKRLIQAHGGAISVDSEIGKGTCFKVSVPRKHQSEDDVTVWPSMPESLQVRKPKAQETNSLLD